MLHLHRVQGHSPGGGGTPGVSCGRQVSLFTDEEAAGSIQRMRAPCQASQEAEWRSLLLAFLSLRFLRSCLFSNLFPDGKVFGVIRAVYP